MLFIFCQELEVFYQCVFGDCCCMTYIYAQILWNKRVPDVAIDDWLLLHITTTEAEIEEDAEIEEEQAGLHSVDHSGPFWIVSIFNFRWRSMVLGVTWPMPRHLRRLLLLHWWSSFLEAAVDMEATTQQKSFINHLSFIRPSSKTHLLFQ